VALSTAQIAGLETQDIVALTTAQARALTEEQIVALTTTQVVAFETQDLGAMTMTQYNAFEGEDFGAMSTAQFFALQAVTPIVLDLNGDGVQTLSAAEGVNFDLTGTGTASKVGWASAQDGLLVRDLNGDGVINDGTELFGGATQLANGQRAGDGYRAMAALDSNGDGKLSAADDAFGELKLWVDADSDGVTDTGELKGLLEMGVAELNLDYTKTSDLNAGNLMGLVGNYTKTDGTQAAMVDVWFAKDAATPTAAELLSGPAAELLGSDAGHAPAAATAGGVGGLVMNRGALDDELLRSQVPLI
jgi:hypothetical protein